MHICSCFFPLASKTEIIIICPAYFFPQFVWMCIFCSILLVSVAFIISSRIYKKMYPGIKLNSEEVVLIPFRYWSLVIMSFGSHLVLWLFNMTSYCSICHLLVIVSSDWPLRLYSLKVWQTERHGQSCRDSITSKNYLHIILLFLDSEFPTSLRDSEGTQKEGPYQAT